MAAGLGFKNFASGEVLTAADVNAYLNSQTVMVFADAAARTAAIASPQEGMFSYLKDTNATQYYTGSAWANLDTTGMTNPMTTTGDTIYSSSGSTPARLGIGSTGQVLTVAAGIPSWATPSGSTPASAVAYVGTNENTTSTSYTDLATAGPAVTLTTGTKAFVILSSRMEGASSATRGFMAFAVSGSTTIAATDDAAQEMKVQAPQFIIQSSFGYIITGLTAGSNTFTAKYKSTTGAIVYYEQRRLSVIDMGS